MRNEFHNANGKGGGKPSGGKPNGKQGGKGAWGNKRKAWAGNAGGGKSWNNGGGGSWKKARPGGRAAAQWPGVMWGQHRGAGGGLLCTGPHRLGGLPLRRGAGGRRPKL